MAMKVGDVVRIDCPASKYGGLEGEVFSIQSKSQYAIVDLPKGSEKRIEDIAVNKIVAKMEQQRKKRRAPFPRWPKGDPQWFPIEWLTVVVETDQSPLQDSEQDLAIED
jgi:hypothetical protein